MLSNLIAKLLALLAAVLLFLTPVGFQGRARLQEDRQWQIDHLASLRQSYAAGERAPVREADFFDGDLEEALNAGMKFNELRVIGTHNSFQPPSVPEIKRLYGVVNRLTFGFVNADTGDYDAKTLTEQLDGGVRSLELDVETRLTSDGVSFTCQHSPNIDMTTYCYSMELALEEIRLWSDNNPGHLPVTILIEPKIWFLPSFDMDLFTLKHALQFDALLRAALGEKLFTPKDMLRSYASFADMRRADDWPRVSEMRGKVLVMLHETLITDSYIAQDRSMHTQAMFPMLRTKDCGRKEASFILVNEPQEAEENRAKLLGAENCIVRVRADSFGSPDEETRRLAKSCGAQILSTDYPPFGSQDEALAFCFTGGKTMAKSE